jgi:hypothetical protein
VDQGSCRSAWEKNDQNFLAHPLGLVLYFIVLVGGTGCIETPACSVSYMMNQSETNPLGLSWTTFDLKDTFFLTF